MVNLTSKPFPWRFGMAYLGLLCIVLFPIWNCDYLPLQDYTNHLARMFVIANIQDDTNLQKFYEVQFNILPNLAMDLTVPWLSHIIPLQLAGRLFVTAIIVLITSGCVFLSWVVWKIPNVMSLASFLIVFNHAFLKGFLNFLIGIGFCLWAIGFWILARDRSLFKRWLLGSLMGLFLFFCHIYAFGVYAIAIVGSELIMSLKDCRFEFKRAAILYVQNVSQLILPLLAYGFSPTADAKMQLSFATWEQKIWIYPQTLVPFSSYSEVLLQITTLFCIAEIFYLFLFKKIQISAAILAPIAAILVVYIFIPRNMSGGWNTDWRLLLPILLLTFSSTFVVSKPKLWQKISAIALVLLVLLQVYSVNRTWTNVQGEYQQIQNLITKIEPGHRLFFTRAYSSYHYECYPIMHAATSAAIAKSAFVPSLFAFDKQQPLQFKDSPIPVIKKPRACPGYSEDIYQDVEWPEAIAYYDYLLIGFPEQFEDLPTNLDRIAAEDIYTLYRTPRLADNDPPSAP